jgi:hypothetical protein
MHISYLFTDRFILKLFIDKDNTKRFEAGNFCTHADSNRLQGVKAALLRDFILK